MDKYDYITATVEEEKIRLEKLVDYLKENNLDNEIPPHQERYNNILKYLNAKKRYFDIEKSIKDEKRKLEDLNKTKDEYELDNILLEDTLLSKFHEDTGNIYRNILFENIKNEEEKIQNLLYLLFEKQSSYNELIVKRNRLKPLLNKKEYPNTYNTLVSQGILIEKQNSILDEIFLLENNIKIEEEKQKKIIEEVMTDSILKILYEFWITDSYDKNKVNKNKIFKDNRTLITIKNSIPEKQEEIKETKEEVYSEEKEDVLSISNLNLPGVNENTMIEIDGKNYIK